LGILYSDSSFPVGKVQFETMNPLNFEEFLTIIEPSLTPLWSEIKIFDKDPIDPFYHKKFLELFRTYLAIGGMPEAVFYFQKNFRSDYLQALNGARKIQQNLNYAYKSDFLKYSGRINANHILAVFESIPTQLAQVIDESVSKYKFAHVIPKSDGFLKIEGPLTWLVNARLAIKVFICNKSEEPLAAFRKDNKFKLYYFDVGLLNAALNIPINKLVADEVGSYKGFIAENFIACEFNLLFNETLNSWAEGDSEIEFIIHHQDELVPIEVKSSTRFLRSKSLDSYLAKYHPKTAIKLSPNNRGFNSEKNIWSIPIYLAGKLG
jgi:predicted AAA+ superfamily ATPase